MKSRYLIACAVPSLCLAGTAAMAQAQPADGVAPAATSQDAGLQDIVVTAQRRSESLQKVPIAITAVGAEALETRGVATILDLRATVPSLNVSYNAGFVNPYLRGIGSNAGGPGVENPIAIYIDGVYVGASAGSLLQFSNIERVEVLKGPQGTLFGRNATGGLVQVITKDPTQELTGSVRATYGNYDYMKGEAYLAGGLSENLRADIALQYTHQGDGWGRNVVTGNPVYDIDHDLALRSKWVFEPSAGTKFTLIGDYSNVKDTLGQAQLAPGTRNGLNPNPPVYPGRYDAVTDRDFQHKGRQYGVSLRWDQDLGNLSLASITAYRNTRWQLSADLDFSTVDALFIEPDQQDSQFSQEIQLLSPSGGGFTWVVGAYYFHAVGKYQPLAVNIPVASISIDTYSSQKVNSIAGFAQGTYEITPTTKVTLGGRYTSEKRSLVGRQEGFTFPGHQAIPGFPGLVTADTDRTFNKFTFRISADQSIGPDTLVYASFNRGFKAGGFNGGLPASTLSYTPETLDAYEVGLKSSLLDNRVRLNIAGFYYDYKDLQVQELLAGTINVVNGGAAKLYGGEVELEAKVTRDLMINASASYLHTEFTDFPNAVIGYPDGSQPPTIGSAKGNRLPFAPTATFNLGVDYRLDLAGGDLHLNGSLYHNAGWYGAADNLVRQKAFSQVNLSAKWIGPGDHLNVTAWVKNLTNVRVQSYQSVLSDGSIYVQWAAPRTYGLTLGYDF